MHLRPVGPHAISLGNSGGVDASRMVQAVGSSTTHDKRWLIALLVAGLFGNKAFADCVPSPDTPAPVIEYFKSFNKPLPEQFCAEEDAAPQASEESPQEPPQACEDAPEAPQVIAALKDQTTKLGAPKVEGNKDLR